MFIAACVNRAAINPDNKDSPHRKLKPGELRVANKSNDDMMDEEALSLLKTYLVIE